MTRTRALAILSLLAVATSPAAQEDELKRRTVEVEVRREGLVEILDHTPPPPADPAELPEPLRDLSLPQDALAGLGEVCSSDGAVRSVQMVWLSGHRYLWRVELAEAPGEEEAIGVYIDTDADEATGREDARGTELLLQVGPDRQRALEWMADGTAIKARMFHSAIDGGIVWFTVDHPLRIEDGTARCRFWINTPDGETDPIEATVPADGPRQIELEQQGEPEVGDAGFTVHFTSDDGELAVEGRVNPMREQGLAVMVTITNHGERDRWLDVSLPLPVPLPMKGQLYWFDGFNFTPHEIGEADIAYHGSSAVTPVTCLWDDMMGLLLAVNPWNMLTELHSSLRMEDDQRVWRLGSRLCISPREAESLEFLFTFFNGELGWRGAFEHHWALFPDAYERATDIDPRFHMASAGSLYRSWTDPESEEFAADLIRRLHAKWEWGYAPAPRPGEWAVTERSLGEWTRSRGEVSKSLTAENLPEVRQRIRQWVHEDAKLADVAVAYYMHLKYVEKGLVEKYWSDSYFRNPPTEYLGYYQFVPCWNVYPWANSYGQYLRDAIPLIVERFRPAGVAFDSVFGFIPHWGPSALRSPGTTFENGRAFVGEGIGFAEQMQVVRDQHTGDHRTAMVTNLKLPTLSADAVRTDAALLEFHPMGNPGYRERILRLRMLSGRIMFNWWHSYDPKYYDWIPWEELSPEQTADAFRRLRDDLLIRSLYYGGVPNARFMCGVPKLAEAAPMLVEVADLGWEPVIAAEPQESDLLVSRYGSGLGMAFGVGNQGYQPIEDRLAVNTEHVAEGDDLAFLEWSGEPTVTELTGEQPRLAVSVPGRDVRAYRAVMRMPAGTAERVTVSGDLHEHQRCSMTFEVEAAEDRETSVTIWLPDGALAPTVEPEATLAEAQYLTSGSLGGRLILNAGTNRFTVVWRPPVMLRGERQALLDYAFVADGRANCNVVAAGDTRDLAFRVQEYFREYYRWAVEEPQTVKLPIVAPEQAPEGRRVVIGLLDDVPEELREEMGTAAGVFGRTGEVVFAMGRTPEMLERAVEGLLFTLDERYEWWGPFYPVQHFFRGKPEDSLRALQEMGIAGGTLRGPDTGLLPNRDELPGLIEWP
ncbi:MAG: hypothetical protein U9R79_02960 [Armatimonadota bacterium]|nr:hypothetical protein [Armatimonadota bacterium]